MFMNHNTIQSEGYTHIFTFFGVITEKPYRKTIGMLCTCSVRTINMLSHATSHDFK